MAKADSTAPKFTLLEIGFGVPQRPRDVQPSEDKGRRRVVLDADNYLQARALIDALHELNEPPTIFQRAGSLIQIVSSDGEPSIKPFDPDTFVSFAQERLKCVRVKPITGGQRDESANISRDVAKHVLNASNWPFPKLRGIARSPHFSATGKLVKESGYSPESQLYVELNGFTVPHVKPIPIQSRDVARAKEIILGELLVDFPFADQASRANAVALGLLPFARELIDGPTPLHVLDASTEGTGKSLLTYVQTFVANGSRLKTMSEGQDDSEMRKRITAALQNSPDMLIFDNVSKKLDSGALAAVLTTTHWEDRLLGSSQTVTLPNAAIWMATGNNISASKEIARRLVWIRLDAKMEKPWLRKDFKHSNLKTWLKENRAEVVHAYLTLIQFWISCGKPRGEVRLGSFESWSEVIGGILENAGISGFLTNLDSLHEHADAESLEWRAFVDLWADRYQKSAVGTAELLVLAKEHDLLMAVVGDGNGRSQGICFGRALGRYVDRVFGKHTIKRANLNAAKKVNQFYLSITE